MDRLWISNDKGLKEYEDGVEHFLSHLQYKILHIKTPSNVHACRVVI